MDKLYDYSKLIEEVKKKQPKILQIVNKIKKQCYPNVKYLRSKTVMKLKNNGIAINLWEQNGLYYEGMQYCIPNNVGFYDGFWIYSDIYEFYNNYIDNKELEFKIHKMRYYGETKLSKPKELKGIKQFCSIDYIPKKCKCSCFILGDDVWVQHKDYFSTEQPLKPEERGMPLKMLCERYGLERHVKSFVYADAWGSIILRNEAWLVIKNLIHNVKLKDVTSRCISDEITRKQEQVMKFKKFELEDSEMSWFWQKLVLEVEKYIKENDI